MHTLPLLQAGLQSFQAQEDAGNLYHLHKQLVYVDMEPKLNAAMDGSETANGNVKLFVKKAVSMVNVLDQTNANVFLDLLEEAAVKI